MRCISKLSVALLSLSAAANAQVQLCEDSFDYPAGSSMHAQAGGTGWVEPWWSSPTGVSGMDVFAPGMDGVGNKVQVVFEGEGAYRKPDTALAPDLEENGLLGKDGGVLWVSFQCVRPAGCLEQFGGISLYEQFVGEKLFIGSPWATGQWGLGVPGVGDFPIVGTSCDVQANLVVRIDFLPGDERVRLYVDPAGPYPQTGEVLDITVPDFRMNEIGLRSGGTTFAGGTFNGGFEFDALTLSSGGPSPVVGVPYCDGAGGICPCGNDNDGSLGVAGCANGFAASGSSLRGMGTNSVSAGDLVLEAEGMVPSQPGLLFQGNNAINSGNGNPFGDGLRCAGGGVVRLQVIFGAPDGTGSSSVNVASKGGCAAGDTRRYQLWSRDPLTSPCGSDFNLSNGLEITWDA